MDFFDLVLALYLALVLHSVTMAFLTDHGTRDVGEGIAHILGARAQQPPVYARMYPDRRLERPLDANQGYASHPPIPLPPPPAAAAIDFPRQQEDPAPMEPEWVRQFAIHGLRGDGLSATVSHPEMVAPVPPGPLSPPLSPPDSPRGATDMVEDYGAYGKTPYIHSPDTLDDDGYGSILYT